MPRKAQATKPEAPAPIVATLEPMKPKPQPAAEQALQIVDRTDPHAALYLATERGADPTVMRELIQLARERDALIEERRKREAEHAFVQALTTFKGDPPRIKKTKAVDFVSKRTSDRTNYKYADLPTVVNAVSAGLSAVGLSFRWGVHQEPGKVTVTCVLQHVAGHAERTELFGAPDDSGNKNSIQGVGSAISYLQRYTLLSALGLATEGDDDDGRTTGQAEPELDEAAQSVFDGFMEKLGVCATVGELGKLRMEAIKHYTASSMLPREFVAEYAKRRTELERSERGA